MLHPNRTDEGSLLALWQEELKQAAKNPFLFQLLLKQMQRVLKRLAYFYAQLATLPRRNRRALQRALATSLVGAAMLLALSSAPMVHAASMTVDGTGKADDGKCSLVEAIINSNNDSQLYASAGECPAGSGADTINLPSAGTFDYLVAFGTGTALPTVSSEIVIEANNSTISRNGAAPNFGLFLVDSAGNLTLNDATVSGGLAALPTIVYGGGIINYGGTLEVNNCTLTGNTAFIGGGVNTILGTTTINDSGIYENLAFAGGGLAVINGALTVNNTVLGGNLGYEYGGGIINVSAGYTVSPANSNLTLNNSTVTFNQSYNEGGGIWTQGFYDSTPIAPPKPEGGSTQGNASPKIFEQFLRARSENLNLQDLKSKFKSGALKRARPSGNVKTRPARAQDDDATPKRDGTKRARQAKPKPEAISANTYAITHINYSTIDNNRAFYYGGGIATEPFTRTYINQSVITTNHAGEGGGIHTYYGEVTVTDSTLSYNEAYTEDGGGLRNDTGGVFVTGTTVTGNTAVDDGGGLNNRGNGIMTVVNSTLTGNTAGGDGGGFRNVTGGIATLANVTITENSAAYGGGLANEDDTVTLQRTLISGNTASVQANEVANWYNLVVDDHNLFGHSGEDNADAFYGFSAGATDLTATSNGSDPYALVFILDSTLTNNGGFTTTHALISGSPAIDQAPSADCTAAPINGIDQRGAARNYDGNNVPSSNECDIGATEFHNPETGCALPTGTDFTLANVTFNFSALGSLSCLTVEEMGPGVNPPLAGTNLNTGNWWHIKGDGTGFNSQVTLPFAGADNADMNCRRIPDTATWDCGRSSNTANSITRNGVTEFSDWAVQNNSPTAVNVTGVRGSINKNGNVVLRWRTTAETQIAGFNVYRQGKQGEWKQINKTLRQAKHAGAAAGDRYRFTDRQANTAKTYRYKIQVVYLDGRTEWTDVVKVKRP